MNNSKAFIDSSNTIDDVSQNINDYNPNRKRKTLIVFDDMIADIMRSKKFQSVVKVKELFIRCRKLNFFICIYNSVLFSCPKRCQIKFNKLLNNEDSQQKRITKYCH